MALLEDMMLDYPPSLAAVKKLDSVPDGFVFYEFEWLGNNPKNSTIMKITGAIFREAKSGKNKGKRTIKIPGSKRTVYVIEQEIKAEYRN